MKKDYNILNYFNMRALFMGIGLSRILSSSNEHIFLTLLLGTLIGVGLLYILKIEMKKSIVNIIVSSVIIILGLFILINVISTMYLTKMSKLMIGLPIILLMLYILNKREIVMFRVSNILLILNLILYVIAMFSLVRYLRIDNFYFSDTPLKNVLGASFEYALFSVTPVLLTKDKKYANISLIKTYIISSITMSGLFIVTYGLLGHKLVSVLRYPEYIILKKVSIANTIENIENIISFMWIFDIIVMLLSAGNTIKRNVNKKWLINIIIPILLLITSIINSYYELIILIYKFTPVILFILIILLFTFNKKIIFNKR